MMGRYTEYLEGRADAIRVEDENYAEELLAIAQTFRSLDEALTLWTKIMTTSPRAGCSPNG